MLMNAGREDLSLARLVEAHWDAVAILAEAGRKPEDGAIYGVWASEMPGRPLRLEKQGDKFTVSGEKMFCSGAGLIDRVLVTVTEPNHQLVDIDLRVHASAVHFDHADWKSCAFAETQTSKAIFESVPCRRESIVGESRWYLDRPGFWHGACGPAACWAGGAAGILDYAMRQGRDDSHTLAHLGAMYASVWAMQALLHSAGQEIDQDPLSVFKARVRARVLRHLVEISSTDILRRLARAYGPHPLAMDENMSRRYQELDLYLRQCHAERDLEALGRDLKSCGSPRLQL
jgi:alkylation response protein AidB-like acyl-CoA dehydrogenase